MAQTRAVALRLRIGWDTVDAMSEAALAAAVEKENAANRLDGLDDALNPDLIDPAKLAALLPGLRQAASAHRALARRALLLDPAELHVGTSSPVTPAGLARGVTLEITDADGDPVQARAVVAIDCTLARSRAGMARARVAELVQQAASLEGRDPPSALTEARLRRFAAARAWRDNAAAAASCAPDDPALRTEKEEAAQAARSAAMPRGRMPPVPRAAQGGRQ